MNVKCSVSIAISVAGFIAKPDGDIKWFHGPGYSEAALDGLSYDDFIASVDAIVMGGNPFEKVLSCGSWLYNGTPLVVLSGIGVDIPKHLEGKVKVGPGSPKEAVARLGAEDKCHRYIDGGVTIQRCLKAGLIHEITIPRVPILPGADIPFFGSGGVELPLHLLASTESDKGFIQVRCAVLSGE